MTRLITPHLLLVSALSSRLALNISHVTEANRDEKKKGMPSHATNPSGICVVMRTCPRDSLALRASLLALCNAQKKQADAYYHFHFFVVNTDPNMDDAFISAASETLVNTPCKGSVEKLSRPDSTKPDPGKYGYDITNQAYSDVFARQKNAGLSECAYFLTTSSDNMYNEHLLESTGKLLREGNDLVCFDFVSNHQWPGSPPRQQKSVQLKHGQVDLGSCFISGKVLTDVFENEMLHGASLFTGPWWNADWHLYEKILRRVPKPRTAIIHEVLQLHQ